MAVTLLMKRFTDKAYKYQLGTSMVEVLVTIVILALGLLGLAGLESRLQIAEMESYQRAQALILLNDMASRITSNSTNAASYIIGTSTGMGSTCGTYSASNSIATNDLAAWCSSLQGAGETIGTSKVGVMIGGRGCVDNIGTGTYLVTVAWQGLRPLSAPATVSGATCSNALADLYNNSTSCPSGLDTCRRVVTTIVRIPSLTAL
jgi:type IV pilus assembly protein PilV